MNARLVPELYVAEIARSLAFYTGVLGFAVRYRRPAEGFAYLVREGAALMLEQVTAAPRTWLLGPLEHPFGRGINLQIEVDAIAPLHAAVLAAGAPLVLALEDRWYATDRGQGGNRQFVVADPDGYLLRFFQPIGPRLA